MKPLDLAFKYMEIFYSDYNIEMLRPFLADHLIFEGPLFQFDSADAYLDSLKDDDRAGLSYELIQSFEQKTSACLICQFSKPGISVPMAHLFEIEDDKISKIALIFDTRPFS